MPRCCELDESPEIQQLACMHHILEKCSVWSPVRCYEEAAAQEPCPGPSASLKDQKLTCVQSSVALHPFDERADRVFASFSVTTRCDLTAYICAGRYMLLTAGHSTDLIDYKVFICKPRASAIRTCVDKNHSQTERSVNVLKGMETELQRHCKSPLRRRGSSSPGSHACQAKHEPMAQVFHGPPPASAVHARAGVDGHGGD